MHSTTARTAFCFEVDSLKFFPSSAAGVMYLLATQQRVTRGRHCSGGRTRRAYPDKDISTSRTIGALIAAAHGT